MLWRDNLHSRLVAGMKILLPLAALGMLSTLFLISERFDPGEAVPPAAIELRDRARDEGATNAALAGVTRGGHEVLLRAARFVPSALDAGVLTAAKVAARLRLDTGAEVEIVSAHGEVDQDRNTAVLSGDVTFDTSGGYSLKSDLLSLRFDDLVVESPGPVSGAAPAGELTAGRMILSGNRANGGGADLLFTDGVKLIYQPQSPGE